MLPTLAHPHERENRQNGPRPKSGQIRKSTQGRESELGEKGGIMTARRKGRNRARDRVVRLPRRFRSSRVPPSPSCDERPEGPPGSQPADGEGSTTIIETTPDMEMLDLESRRNALQGQVDTIGENIKALPFEQARPLEERFAEVDGEIRKIEVRIADAPAEGLVGVAVKLRLLDFPRDPDLRDEAQYQACTRTALGAVERLLIAGKKLG